MQTERQRSRNDEKNAAGPKGLFWAEVGYALDLRRAGVALDPEAFVVRAHAQLVSNFGWLELEGPGGPSLVTRGRRVGTTRVGKMPGDQVTVYDKRVDCQAKSKGYWHDARGLDAGVAMAHLQAAAIHAHEQQTIGYAAGHAGALGLAERRCLGACQNQRDPSPSCYAAGD